LLVASEESSVAFGDYLTSKRDIDATHFFVMHPSSKSLAVLLMENNGSDRVRSVLFDSKRDPFILELLFGFAKLHDTSFYVTLGRWAL
jgi:hypothetical protein